MSEQNWQCARCGYSAVESLQPLEYSEAACRLLRTNEPAQFPDEAVIREAFGRSRDMLTCIDDEVAKLQARLDDLQAKRKLIQEFFDGHAAILSPLRRAQLPPEILTKIFHYNEPVVGIDVGTGIWQLGRVCSTWRTVLLSSPSLWSRLSVSSRFSTIRNPASVVEEVLARSGDSPLSITFEYTYEDREKATPVIRIMTTASHRWHAITFSGIAISQLPLLSEVKGRVPLLTELFLSSHSRTFPDWLVEVPSLRKLVLRYKNRATALEEVRLDLPLPWSQLRECNLGRRTLQEDLELLRLCPNIEEYTSYCGRQTESVPSDIVYMPRLHTLAMAETSRILGCLTLPSLNCIVLHVAFRTDPKFVSCLNNLVSRSSCSLTELKIELSRGNSKLLYLLSSDVFQNLTTLVVACEVDDLSTILAILTIHPKAEDSSVELRRLKSLHLRPRCHYSYHVSQHDFTSIIEMTRSRWHLDEEHRKTVQRLAELRFDHSEPESDFVAPARGWGGLAPLLAFSDEGLEIYINRFYLGIADPACPN